MSHSADVARGHKTRKVEEETLEKGVAHVPPGEGVRTLWVLGELHTYKVPSRQTGGAYSLFEIITRPGAGPPPHVHHREDETLHVLEGEYEFLSDEGNLRVGAGSLLSVPRGTLHAHRNVGEGVGRMLVTQTPGGLYERFFEEVGKAVDGESGPPVFEDQADTGKVAEIASEYGIEIPQHDSRPENKMHDQSMARAGRNTVLSERGGSGDATTHADER